MDANALAAIQDLINGLLCPLIGIGAAHWLLTFRLIRVLDRRERDREPPARIPTASAVPRPAMRLHLRQLRAESRQTLLIWTCLLAAALLVLLLNARGLLVVVAPVAIMLGLLHGRRAALPTLPSAPAPPRPGRAVPPEPPPAPIPPWSRYPPPHPAPPRRMPATSRPAPIAAPPPHIPPAPQAAPPPVPAPTRPDPTSPSLA